MTGFLGALDIAAEDIPIALLGDEIRGVVCENGHLIFFHAGQHGQKQGAGAGAQSKHDAFVRKHAIGNCHADRCIRRIVTVYHFYLCTVHGGDSAVVVDVIDHEVNGFLIIIGRGCIAAGKAVYGCELYGLRIGCLSGRDQGKCHNKSQNEDCEFPEFHL